MPTSFVDAQQQVLDRYDVEAESRFVDVPSVEGRAHVLVAGHGPPVVMLDGIGTPAAMLAPLMPHLGGFAIHAVDLPGYGLTGAAPNLEADYAGTAVAFLREVVDALELEQPAIVASSLGSLWAMWFASRYPDRVRALVHVGCPAAVPGSSAPLPMRLLSVRGIGDVMMKIEPPSPKQVERLSKMVHDHPLPPEIADVLLATELQPAYEQTFLPSLRKLLRLRGPRPELAPTREQLADVPQPTLLVFGRDDPFGGPEIGRELAADVFPNAELTVVDGGHVPWIHHADEIGPEIASYLTDQLGPPKG